MRKQLHSLDVLRGMAALLVCAGHARNALLPDFQGDTPWLWVYALTSLGHQAVIVFFVLSGFLIGGSIDINSFDWRRYSIDRLTRLWVVLLPCLLMTALFDCLSLWTNNNAFDGVLATGWGSGSVHRDGWALKTLLGNVLFLQNTAVPVFGSNGPLWSLANEFWYYVAYPLWLAALYSRLPAAHRLISFFCVVVLALLLPQEIVVYYVAWLCGAWANKIYVRSRANFRIGASTLIFGAVAVMMLSKALGKTLGGLTSDFVLALIVAAFLAAASNAVRDLPLGLSVLSKISFSLYLSHFPLLLFISVSVFDGRQIALGLVGVTLLVLILIGLLLFSFAFWWIFERHTLAIRRSIHRLLPQARASHV